MQVPSSMQPADLVKSNDFKVDIKFLFDQAFHNDNPKQRAHYQKLYNQELQNRQKAIINSDFVL